MITYCCCCCCCCYCCCYCYYYREIGSLNYNIGDLIDQELKRESLKLKPSHKDIDKSDWEKVYTEIII